MSEFVIGCIIFVAGVNAVELSYWVYKKFIKKNILK